MSKRNGMSERQAYWLDVVIPQFLRSDDDTLKRLCMKYPNETARMIIAAGRTGTLHCDANEIGRAGGTLH